MFGDFGPFQGPCDCVTDMSDGDDRHPLGDDSPDAGWRHHQRRRARRYGRGGPLFHPGNGSHGTGQGELPHERCARPVMNGSTIDLRWMVSDKNLGTEPVSIYYATRKEGPWQTGSARSQVSCSSVTY